MFHHSFLITAEAICIFEDKGATRNENFLLAFKLSNSFSKAYEKLLVSKFPKIHLELTIDCEKRDLSSEVIFQ